MLVNLLSIRHKYRQTARYWAISGSPNMTRPRSYAISRAFQNTKERPSQGSRRSIEDTLRHRSGSQAALVKENVCCSSRTLPGRVGLSGSKKFETFSNRTNTPELAIVAIAEQILREGSSQEILERPMNEKLKKLRRVTCQQEVRRRLPGLRVE